MTSRSRRPRWRSELLFDRWLKERWMSRHGVTFQQFCERADAGEIDGLEPFAELEEMWDDETR